MAGIVTLLAVVDQLGRLKRSNDVSALYSNIILLEGVMDKQISYIIVTTCVYMCVCVAA